ncbi:hypothetical protein [Yinghuangia sp. YIM S09857]|uniref:hypothetical protein n=1 Tax=Yinghuangia sp. YIM S09857 TaxID=3436929 RepID=UPI003F531230
MSTGIRRRLPGRRLGLTAIVGLLLLASTGVADAALPDPDTGISEAQADSGVTVDRGKTKTKDGVVSTKLTFKISNKGPTPTVEGEFRASVTDGVVFYRAPKGCSLKDASVICPLKRIRKGATEKIEITAILKGTFHKVEASSSSESDPNPANNSLVLEWLSSDPAPKPTPKPSSSPPAKSSKCPATRIEWSKDGGRTWNRGGLLGGFHSKLNVRLADKVDKKCQYKVSLASYSAEGPTWKTSGKQAFLGKHTVTLTGKKPTAVLDISRFMPPCYGQIDLYGSGEKFDGDRLPRYPDRKFPTRMIAGWNGGKACTGPPSSSPPPSSTPPSSTSASPSTSASTSAPPSSRPPTTTPPTTPATSSKPPATTPPSSTPTTTAPSSTPPPPPADTSQPPAEQVPVDDAPAPPGPDDQRNTTEPPYVDGDLPRTGADRIPYLIALAVFSVLLGALAIAWSRWGTLGAFGRTSAPAPAHAANPWINRPRNPWIN